MVDYGWVGGENRVNVGKVLIEIGMEAPGKNSPGNVRAASGESSNVASQGIAIKAREDQFLVRLIFKVLQGLVAFWSDRRIVG